MRARPTRPWWQTTVVYEIYLRSFQDSDGDGIGDLAGLGQRAGYLAELGIGAVWITPFQPSPMADFGYDVADYTGVDPIYGDLDGFDAVVAALAARGIRTIVDLVPNHTSDRHPWFVEARASRASPRRDWYLWRDPAPDGGPPNNWLCQGGGSAWTLDLSSGQYYLHSFLPEQPDLNWRHPGVRAAFAGIMRFWLARGVDGFRVDALQGLLKDPLWRDDPPNPGFRPGDPGFTRLDPVNSSNQPDVLDIVAGMRAVIAEFPGDRVLIGEIYRPVEALVGYYGAAGAGVQVPFNFTLFWVAWRPEAVIDLVARYEALLPPGAWPNWVVGNHDFPRVASRLGAAQARVAMMLVLTLRGTPTLYQGDELGLEDAEVPPDRVRDPFARDRGGRGRDPQRAPMPWDTGAHGGFSTAEPWLPAVAPGRVAPASVQAADPGSMLSLTRALLALRRREPALAEGDWRPVSADDGVLAYDRVLDGRACRVALNMRPVAARVAWPWTGSVAVSTRGGPPRRVDGPVALAPDEGVVLVPGDPAE